MGTISVVLADAVAFDVVVVDENNVFFAGSSLAAPVVKDGTAVVAVDALSLVLPNANPPAPPLPKLNPPEVLPPPAVAAVVFLPTEEDEAALDNPEVNDKAFTADLEDDAVAPPPVKDDPKPANGKGVVVALLLLLLFPLSPPPLVLLGGADDDPVEGSADMNDEPNIVSYLLLLRHKC